MRAWRVGSILTDFSAQSFGVNFSARASFRLEMRINFRLLPSLLVECLGLTMIVPLVTCSHWNVCRDSDKPAGATNNSDVQAAAMLQPRSFGSASGSSCSSAQVRHSLPFCSLPVAELTVATGSSSSSIVHTAEDTSVPVGTAKQ